MIQSIPNSFRITSDADGVAASGILVLVTVKMSRKNHFQLIVGPSDTNGQITVSRTAIHSEIALIQDRFPMDYASVSDAFAGQLEIRPLTLRQIQSAIDACQQWHGIATFPGGHLDRLTEGLNVLKAINPHRISVVIDDISTTVPSASIIPSSVSDPIADPATAVAI